MLISNDYLINDANNIPENTSIKKCRICNCTYAVPNNLYSQTTDICDKKECKEIIDKEIANMVHLLMKPSCIENASDIIKKALGK